MRIWLVTIGEPVPLNKGSNVHLFRTGYLAHFLAERGHQVVWWTSAFDHFRKEYISNKDSLLAVNDHLEIKLLYGGGYSSNLSPMRILDHRRIAAKFLAMAPRLPVPDIILCSFPTIELSLASVKYSRQHDVPAILDMRDMWPDIFLDAVPKPLHRVASLLIWHMDANARAACAGATSITGITESFVDWGLKKAGRSRNPLDRAFPMGYISVPPATEKIAEAEKYWAGKGIDKHGNDFIACFFGTLGRHLDLETVLHAAGNIHKMGKTILFVICGIGDRLEYFQKVAKSDPRILFPGWVDAAQIYVLMRRAQIGLDPLPERYDFLATINNKAIEYMSAGLPVISSPDRGVLCNLLKEHQCGMSYPHGESDALTGILSRLYDDRDALRKMSENSMRVYQKMFTAEKVYSGMMDYLFEVAEKYKQRRRFGAQA